MKLTDWYERHVKQLIHEAAEVYETMTDEEIDQMERDLEIERRKTNDEG